jgi:uncharacterized Zn finger protein (UPF0148 family)
MASQGALGQDGQDDPHWKKDTCQTCHETMEPTADNVALKMENAEQLCDTCHGSRGKARPCRHSSGIPAGDHDMPESYRASLVDGQLVCTTCHDVTYQCKHPAREYSFQNRGFLRDRVSRTAGDQCYECHEKSGYEKLNPHAGIAGIPPRPTCQLCHKSLPHTSAAGQLVVEFNMEHDLNDTCRGCHVVQPHPKSMSFSKKAQGWVHLVEPPAEVIERMQKTQADTGIGLPLNPINGEVFCATCHNPHDFKVGGEHGSQKRAPKNRLRRNNICQACHDK